jgi:hypothetical protein
MSSANAPRLTGVALVAALAVLAGCGTSGAPVGAPVSTTNATTNLGLAAASTQAGRVEIHVQGLGGYHVAATVSQVTTLHVTLTGGGLAAPLSKDLSTASLAAGKGTVTFDNIPAGAFSIEIKALDAAGASLGTSVGTTTVTGGQTAVVAVSLQLNATHVTSSNGAVAIDVAVTDGAVVVDPILSPSPRPSTSELSPAPSPTPTATPTPAPSGTVAVSGDPVKQWYTNGMMGVSGTVSNTWPMVKGAKVTATFYKRTMFGTAQAEVQTQDVGLIWGNSSAKFDIKSVGNLSNWRGEGDVTVTVQAY